MVTFDKVYRAFEENSTEQLTGRLSTKDLINLYRMVMQGNLVPQGIQTNRQLVERLKEIVVERRNTSIAQ